MASRQPLAADPHLGLEEEDAVSGTGEGDEIMEEAEEQEDGYSAYLISFISCCLFRALVRQSDTEQWAVVQHPPRRRLH